MFNIHLIEQRANIAGHDIAPLREATSGRRGSRLGCDWWELADPAGWAMSPLETRVRLIAHDAGAPPDELQHRFEWQGQHIATVDLWWQGPPPLIVEADGRAAHDPTLLGEAAREDPFVTDRRRQNRLRLLYPQAQFLRYTWADLRHPRRIAGEIHAALGLALLP